MSKVDDNGASSATGNPVVRPNAPISAFQPKSEPSPSVQPKAPAKPKSKAQTLNWDGVVLHVSDDGRRVSLPDGQSFGIKKIDAKHKTVDISGGDTLSVQNGAVVRHHMSADGAGTIGSLHGGMHETGRTIIYHPATPVGHQASGSQHTSSPLDVLTASISAPAPKTPKTKTVIGAAETPTTPVPPPAPNSGTGGASGPVYAAIAKAAAENGVPIALALAIAQHESGFDASNKTGDNGHSWGLYQLYDKGEGAGMGNTRLDPYTNASTALRVVGETLRQHPDWSWGQVAAAAQRPKYPDAYARTIDGIVNQAKSNPNYFSTALAQHGGGGTGVTVSGNPLPVAGADGGTVGGGAGSAPTNGTGPLNLDTLAQQYGYAAAYLNGIPELRTLFQQAFSDPAGQWTPDKFAAKLRDTRYFKSHNAAQASWDQLNLTQHPLAQQKVKDLSTELARTAKQMGAVLSPLALHDLAVTLLSTGKDSDTDFINHALAQHLAYKGGSYSGGALTTQQQLEGLYRDYGLQVDPVRIQRAVSDITQGKTTLEDFTQEVKNLAKSQYPTLSDAIDRGTTVADYASQYRQVMSQILEIPPESVSLADPTIRKALASPDPKTGQPMVKPLWQFENDLRADPRWLHTDNARDQYMSTASTVLQQMGLAT